MRDHVRICGSPGRETDRGHPAQWGLPRHHGMGGWLVVLADLCHCSDLIGSTF